MEINRQIDDGAFCIVSDTQIEMSLLKFFGTTQPLTKLGPICFFCSIKSIFDYSGAI